MSRPADFPGLGVAIAQAPNANGPYVFRGDLISGMAAAAEIGYSGVELSLLDSRRVERRTLIDAAQRLGLRFFAIATGLSSTLEGFSLFADDAACRGVAIERMRGHVDLAKELACPVIIGGIRGRITADGPDAASLAGWEAVRQCVAYADWAEVRILLEPLNRYETNLVNTTDEGLRIIEELGAPNVRLLLDTFHMNIEERSIEESIRAAGKNLGYMHYADSNRHAPGWGHVDFPAVLNVLRSLGTHVDATIEILPIPNGRDAAVQALQYISRLSAKAG